MKRGLLVLVTLGILLLVLGAGVFVLRSLFFLEPIVTGRALARLNHDTVLSNESESPA